VVAASSAPSCSSSSSSSRLTNNKRQADDESAAHTAPIQIPGSAVHTLHQCCCCCHSMLTSAPWLHPAACSGRTTPSWPQSLGTPSNASPHMHVARSNQIAAHSTDLLAMGLQYFQFAYTACPYKMSYWCTDMNRLLAQELQHSILCGWSSAHLQDVPCCISLHHRGSCSCQITALPQAAPVAGKTVDISSSCAAKRSRMWRSLDVVRAANGTGPPTAAC
jgi:hypothetical protein